MYYDTQHNLTHYNYKNDTKQKETQHNDTHQHGTQQN